MASGGQFASERYVEAMRPHAILDSGIQQNPGWRLAGGLRSAEDPEQPVGLTKPYTALLIMRAVREARVSGSVLANVSDQRAGRPPSGEPACDRVDGSIRHVGQRRLL